MCRAAGSAGASNQPLGVSRSTRPSPLTSPEPTPCPAACCAEVVLLELESLAVALLDDLVPDDHVDRVGQDVGTPSPERSTIQAASMLPGTSTS